MLNIERVNRHWQRLHTECARYQQTAHSSLGCVLSCFWDPSSYTELHETLHLDGRSFRCDAVIFSSGNEPRTPQMMRLLGQRFPYMCALSIRINLYKNIDMHLSQVEGMLNSLCDAFTQLMTSLLHLRHLYIDQWSQYHLLTDELLCQSLSHFTTLESFYLDQIEAGLYCKYEIPTPIVSTLCQCPRLTIISGDLLVRRLSPNQWLTIFSTLDQIRCLTVRGRNGVMGSVMSVLHGSRAIALSHGSTNNPPPPHLPDDRKAAFIRATSHIRALWYYSSARSSRGRLLEGMSITDIPLTQLRTLETCQDTPAMKFCSTIHLLTQLRELTIRCDEMTGEEMIRAFSSLSHLHFLSLNRPPQCECVNEWMTTLFNGLQHLRCLAFESECTLITSEMSSIVNSCLQLVELRLAGNFTAGLIENDIGANILSIIESHSTLQILTLDESFDKIIRKKVMMTNHGGKKEKALELELAPSTSFSRFQLMRRRSRAGLTWLDLLNSSVKHIATLLSLAESRSRVASTSWYSELFTSPNAHYANWYRMKRIEEYEQLDCTMKSSKDDLNPLTTAKPPMAAFDSVPRCTTRKARTHPFIHIPLHSSYHLVYTHMMLSCTSHFMKMIKILKITKFWYFWHPPAT